MGTEHEAGFYVRVGTVTLLVLFAGLMSGLTLGLMSMSLVDLEVLAKSGTPRDRNHARKILPVVERQHLLLCTLLICNAAAMEALPIFMDDLVPAWGAILLSVTLILLFGEIIPQAVCSRYGLAIGAAAAPVVRVLVWICFPIAYPISKLLDLLLGTEHDALFRRAELQTLLDFHGNEAGKGGELTRDETTIIAGALGLSGKTARDAMTPISETFSIDINAKLDRSLMKLILENGHSRVPVYHEQPKNVIGLILVKNLLPVRRENEVLVKNVTLRKIPRYAMLSVTNSVQLLSAFNIQHRIGTQQNGTDSFISQSRVSESMPLYDILNEFQKGHSHMAVVIKGQQDETKQLLNGTATHRICLTEDAKVDIDEEERGPRTLKKLKHLPAEANTRKENCTSKKWANGVHSEVLQIDDKLPRLAEGEAIGIITLEDVIEELLQEEIFDETDYCEEGHCSVAAIPCSHR